MTSLSVPQIETKIANFKKGIKRSRGISRAGKILAIGATALTIGIGANNLKNDEKINNKTAVPAGIALASFVTAIGADKSRKNKSITLQEAQAELIKAKAEEAEERRLEEKKKQEETRKAAELKEAQKAEEKAKSRLFDLEQLPLQQSFCFAGELDNFGVVDRKPYQKEGGDWNTGKPVPDCNYREYYKTKDGCTVVAGIEYATVPQGVERKDYTYRYVRVIDPKVEGVVCEEGQLNYLNEEGYAVSMRVEKVLSSCEKDYNGETKRTYKKGKDFYAIKSDRKVSYFPKYEQQIRERVMRNAIQELAGYAYQHPTYSTNMNFDPVTGKTIHK